MNLTGNNLFEFSVIMAVYNVEDYLRESVESLIAQDFGFEKIQLILVDDGSTDNSGNICDEYALQYPNNIKVIHKENGGVASARNEGLKYAEGRFLNFMDSDDRMSKDAFRKVYQFFCEHENETDIVTLPIELFDGESGPHWQNWKFDQGSRIIDLNTEDQTTVMFVTASFFSERTKNRIQFDSKLVVAEDMKVLLTILADKMTLGVVADSTFYYRKRKKKADSLVQSARKKRGWYFEYFECFFDWIISYYKERFGYLPGFLQYELMYDLQWRFSEKYDMSGVLSKEEQMTYKDRLFSTLSLFDDQYIVKQRYLEEHLKVFLLKKKHNMAPTLIQTGEDIQIKVGNTDLEPLSAQTIRVDFLKIENHVLIVEGTAFLHGLDVESRLPQIRLTIAERDIACVCSHRKIDDRSCFGEITQWAIAFHGEVNCENFSLPQVLQFATCCGKTMVRMKVIQYGEFTPIGSYRSSYYINRMMLQPAQGGIRIAAKPKVKALYEIKFLTELWRANAEGTRKAVAVRLLYHILKLLKRKTIWLVSDRVMKAGDNGEAFFRYLTESPETNKEINKFFLLNPASPDYKSMMAVGKVVPMLSMKHKLLYLLCDYNISSHADDANMNPFRGHQEGYRDMIADKRFVFLQHGVIKDDLSGWLARSRMNLYGFVTSAHPEYQSIVKGNYGYSKEVWLTGLPRFDRLPAGNEQVKRITIAPTWRAYLLPTWDYHTGERLLSDRVNESSFLKFYNKLLNHDRLLAAAREYGYQITFFPHPNFQNYLQVFDQNQQVDFWGREKNYLDVYAESALMVTDYSSAVFDFVYMEKPVVYAQFDKAEFYAGEHVYQQGYFDYEQDGFGEVRYDLESTVDCIIEYMQTGCQMKEKYRSRARQFFAFHDRNNCKRVYQKIISDGK